MYKYETHAHTSEASKCGHISAADGVRMYHEAGYQGMVFTDHFNESNMEPYGDVPWQEKVDRYLDGYRNAATAATQYDMDVFWGIEIRFTENDNDYLVYGLDEEFLKKHDDILSWSITRFMESVAGRDDVLVYQAHPYRKGCAPLIPPVVDGFEIYNGNPRHDSQNGLATSVAEEHQLLILSGSDFHRTTDLATGGVVFPTRVSSMAEFVEAIRAVDATALIMDGKVNQAIA